jgi:hypothetical protein
MPLQNIWKPFGLQIDCESIAGTICGLTNYSVPDAVQVERPSVDGSPYASITRMMSREEQITATSLNIDSVLDVTGVGGQCLTGEDPHSVKFWLAAWDQCSSRPMVGAFHRYYGLSFPAAALSNRGIISLDSIQCNNRQDATAQFKIDCIADPTTGLSFALTKGVNQSLPPIADNGRRYTLGKMTVGGVLIESKTGFEISTNIGVERIPVDSEISARFVHINDHKAVITIRGIDPAWAVPENGLACTHANTILYLRRRGDTAGVDFEPDNQAKHIKFTVKGRAYKTQLAGGGSNSPSETVLMIYPEYDSVGSMVPIVATTGQLIT